MSAPLFTIGHSNRPLEVLLDRLATAGVSAVADVRSSPFSRYTPHFNREALRTSLAERGIAYVFLGDLLGGRPADPGLYDETGRADYEAMAGTEAVATGLTRLEAGLTRFVVAVLCSEEDPRDCHRRRLVAHEMAGRGHAIVHLRLDGRTEPEDVIDLPSPNRSVHPVQDGFRAGSVRRPR